MLDRYVAWMTAQALPFWLARGAELTDGFFWESLDLEGRPLADSELRVRTQARQIYVFAHAACLGLVPREPATARAGRALAWLRRAAWAPDGRPGWVHRLSPAGAVTDDRRDLYDHAFVLHALGWYARAAGDATARQWIDETIGFIDSALAAAGGGWAESDRRELPRRQNPHMHAFEAFLALQETMGDGYLARAGELFELFRTRFVGGADGLLRERYGALWETGAAYGSERLEPGHMLEWVWLLRRYARAGGPTVDGLCAGLLAAGRRLGVDPASGFVVDMVDEGGRRLLDGRRLWPQTEYLKALVVEHAARGDPALRAEAEALAGRLLATYLADCPPGTWRDAFTLDGRCTATTIPASTLYHLLAAAVTILQHDPMQ